MTGSNASLVAPRQPFDSDSDPGSAAPRVPVWGGTVRPELCFGPAPTGGYPHSHRGPSASPGGSIDGAWAGRTAARTAGSGLPGERGPAAARPER